MMNSNSICIKKATITSAKYTIAIPTYKRARFLKEAIYSASKQKTVITYNILVVDNNPERNDETEHLINQIAIPNLSYYKNKANLGMTGNWNQLYYIAETEWVIMLHDDDLLSETYISTLDSILRSKELGAAKVISMPYESTKIRIDIKSNKSNIFKTKRLKPKDFIIGNVCGAPLGLVVNRDYITSGHMFRERYYPSADWFFYIDATFENIMYQVAGSSQALYFIGENESLKLTTIKGFFKDSINIPQLLNRHLSLKYKIKNMICCYARLENTRKWVSEIAGAERTRIIFQNSIFNFFPPFVKNLSWKVYKKCRDEYIYSGWTQINI